jgi:phenylacetate-CoA ligase
MTVFGKFLMKNPDYDIRPDAITLRAEKLYPAQRELLENVFQCACFEFYGMWEYLIFAAECEYHRLHLDFELGIAEIVKDGRLCSTGEIGEVVATGLHNYSMPLIKYATGDYGCIRDERCQCGRKMPIIKIVGGREKDLIVTRKGFFNVMSGLPLMFGKNNIIKQVQFYQENKDTLVVRLVKGEEFSDSDREGVKAAINNYLLNSIDITLEFLEYIPRTSAGKYRYVISKVPIEV